MIREEASNGTGKAPNAAFPIRRTFKLVWLKDVGPGWQVVQKRDLYPCWTNKQTCKPKHNYKTALSAIRVAGGIKDVGEIDLSKENPAIVYKENSKAAGSTANGKNKNTTEDTKDIQDLLLE